MTIRKTVSRKTAPKKTVEVAYGDYLDKLDKLWVKYVADRKSTDRLDPACKSFFADEAVAFAVMMKEAGYGTDNDKAAIDALLKKAANRMDRADTPDLNVTYGQAESRYQTDLKEKQDTVADLENTLRRQAMRLYRASVEYGEGVTWLRDRGDIPAKVEKAFKRTIKSCRKLVLTIDRE